MAAVTPVASVAALVRAIQKSGLLSAEALAKVQEAATKVSEPKQLARDLVKSGTLTRWQAEQLLHGFHRLIVDKYKLLDQIGTSPTGRIYLVEHVQIGRRHALKVLAKRLASRPEAVKRFLAAAQTACGLDHRNVSHCYDVNQDHERQSHYVVMEYVEGESLERIVEREGRLAPPLALNYIVQAADGLIHAHQNGVVHGDLKPANLILDATGTIKILEMGQASAGAAFEAEGADEAVEMAALAAVIFQPPELRGDGEVPTIACDIYSLGSLLTFLLTGQAAADAAVAGQRLRERSDVPAELIELCQRMMAQRPADRPQAVASVADELVACAQKLAAAESEVTAAVVAASEQSSSSGKGKAKKPPVAKPLDSSGPMAIVIPGVTQPVVEPAATEPFVIKTRGRVGKKPAPPAATAPANADTPAAAIVTDAPTSFSPLVLGAIGGGVFVVVVLLFAVVALIIMATRRSKPALATAPPAAPASAAAAAAPSGEEANPTPPPGEQNPEVNPLPAAAPPDLAAETTTPAAPAATPLEPVAPADDAKPAPPADAAPEPKPAEPPAKSTLTEPEKTEAPPTKVETKDKAKSAAKATAKPPAKPPAKPEPFKGLAKAVALPALPDAAAQNAATAAPVALGPCKLDDQAALAVQLAGGETAVRGTRHRFELQQKPEAKHAWEVLLTGVGSPSAIATLTADGKDLKFQWTEEAGKQATVAKQLANCALKLLAGAAQHTLALREPVKGPPLAVEIDKPGATTRWAIGDLPPAKQMFVEVLRAEGPKGVLVDPKGAVTIGEDVNVWFGESSEMLPLVIKLDTSTNSRDLEIKQQPYIKLEGQEPRLYRKKEVQLVHQQTMQRLMLLDPELKKAKDARPKQEIEKKIRDQKVEVMMKQRLDLGTVLEQINFAVGFAEDYKGTALVQLRVYYQADDVQVELMRTAEPAPPAKAK